MRWPAQACIDQGADAKILEPHERNVFGALKSNGTGKVISVQAPDDCELLVIQRPTSAPLVRSIPFLRAKGIAVAIDVDDDLSAIHPSNPAFRVHHPTYDPNNNWRWLEQACKDATMIFASTPALAAKYGAHGRVRVLRNCVPDHYLDVEPAGERWDGFGWAGALWSHPDDLPVTGAAVTRLVRGGYEFRVVGPPDGVARSLGLAEDPPSTGLVSFTAWPSQVARLSVGVAPLAPTRFNEAKSAWKLLEYAALSVPFVASNSSSEYARLINMGVGVGALKGRDWYRELRSLLDSADLRDESAGKARAVAEELTYSSQSGQWTQAWSDALKAEHPRAVLR